MERKKFVEKFFSSSKRENVEKFDELVEKDLKEAYKRGVEFLGIKNEPFEFESLVTSYPEGLLDKPKAKIVYDENKMRYNIARFTNLSFGRDFLYYYTVIVDHGLGEIYNDYSLDVSYLDVRGIEVSFKFKIINDVYHHILELKLLLQNGSIDVPLRVFVVDKDTDVESYKLKKETVEHLTNLKQFLRNKMSI
ncbi:MAG: hypothetical protein GX931_04440 [Acholeplasmataceae bacterium]|nr:hypothetical protein [Acholeplasmataceae bacterium]